MQSEDDVLSRAASGDQRAFECIVSAHQGMVFSVAYHFLRNRAVAEELAQEVFLALYQNLKSIKSPTHLVFWLRKVTSNRCLDQARRQKLRAHLSLDDVPEPTMEMRDSDSGFSGSLKRLVGCLPEKQKMVLILRYQEDLDPLDIARVLDMPVNTVKSHLRRSLAALRDKLTCCLGN